MSTVIILLGTNKKKSEVVVTNQVFNKLIGKEENKLILSHCVLAMQATFSFLQIPSFRFSPNPTHSLTWPSSIYASKNQPFFVKEAFPNASL